VSSPAGDSRLNEQQREGTLTFVCFLFCIMTAQREQHRQRSALAFLRAVHQNRPTLSDFQ
jgi:hypothetical protein